MTYCHLFLNWPVVSVQLQTVKLLQTFRPQRCKLFLQSLSSIVAAFSSRKLRPVPCGSLGASQFALHVTKL